MSNLSQTVQDFLAIYQLIDDSYTIQDLENNAKDEHACSCDDLYDYNEHFENAALQVLTYNILNELEYNYEIKTSERFVSGNLTELKVNGQQIVDVNSYRDFIENAKSNDDEWQD